MLSNRLFRDWIPAVGLIILVVGVVANFGSAASLNIGYDDAVSAEKVEALEAAGYTYVSFSRQEFTANKDGEFFRGVLVSLDPDKNYAYQIVEVPQED